MAGIKLFLCFIVTTAVFAEESPGTYLVMIPSTMRPGRPMDLSVSILDPSASSTVKATLKRESNELATSQEINVSGKDGPGVLTIEVPADLNTNLDYVVSVEGTGGVTFTNETTMKLQRKTISIFIQTDKGIYKPSQTVKFRTMAVYPDLKPFMGSFDIEIFDKNGNMIKQWLGVSDTTGVISNELQLSDQPPLGDWRISVEANGWKEEKTFSVDEYVLPKFEVTVDLPSYYSVEMMDVLHGSVNAKYTYGQPVKGKATVKIQLQPYGSYDRSEYKYIGKTIETNDGKVDFSLTEEEIVSLVPRPYWYSEDRVYSPNINNVMGREILVVANFTERETGIILSGNNTVEIPRNDFKLKFMDGTPDSFKPGLSYTAFIQLSQADDMPPTSTQLLGKDGQPVPVSFIATFSFSGYVNGTYINRRKEAKYNLTVPASGIMNQVIDIPPDFSSVSFQARFKSAYAYKNAQEFKSKEKKGIQITLQNQDGPLKAGDTANFVVKSTDGIEGFTVEVMSKGKIVHSEYQETMGQNPKALDIPLDRMLAAKLAPSARIVVWYMTEKGEIITDSLNFNVDGAFANDVSVSFSTNETRPGEMVDVSVTAYPQSYIGLLAVDQSVLLLKGGNDIEESQVLSELESYDSTKDTNGHYPMPMFERGRKKRCARCGFWWPIFSGGTDSSEIFENAGVIVLTDAYVYKEPPPEYPWRRPMGERGDAGQRGPVAEMGPVGERGPAGPAPSAGTSADRESTGLAEPTRVRKSFPETWLWSDVISGADGTAKISTKVPDTITSWVASGFALSTDMGLGLAPTRPKLTVFKPFFVSLNLPYSVIRGEEFPLQVVVFNYMEEDQEVTVTLKGSQEYLVREGNDIEGKTMEGDSQGQVKVKAGDSGSVFFWIVPRKLGYISFEVKGQTTRAADAVKKYLLVEPEGAPKEESEGVMIKLTEDKSSFTAVYPINFPEVGLVPGSEYITVSVVGDIMGSTMNNLDSLLKMPYGCGEQNMLNFAPNIFVMQYLSATDQVKGDIRDKAIHFMESGYQRELTYQRDDGSFSAFGNSDKAGSMWLTAFVIKSFNSARQFITIDQKTIDTAARWILNHQGKDGSFQEPEGGRVIHREMQGGSSGGLPLTAYTLVSLLENRETLQANVDEAIKNAKVLLESSLDSISKDPYSLALVTYALQLAGSDRARDAFDQLNDLATTEDGLKYWTKTIKEEPKDTDRYWGHRRAKSQDVEMTSYALMSYAHREDIDEGIPIMKYLVSKRSAYGGYSSTQDTVLGLQSLSFFAAKASGGDTDLRVTVSTETDTHHFDAITKENNVLLQTAQLPVSTSQITVSATGQGSAIFQISLKYNVDQFSNKPSVVVNLITEEKEKEVTLNACAKWTDDEQESGMVVMEVYQLTGFVVDTSNLNEYKESVGLKRFETDAQKLTMYFDQFNGSDTCVKVKTTQVTEIRNLKPARALAYSYYDPETVDTKFYTAEAYAANNTSPDVRTEPPSTDGTDSPSTAGTPEESEGLSKPEDTEEPPCEGIICGCAQLQPLLVGILLAAWAALFM